MSDWSEYWRNRKLIEEIAVNQKINRKMSLQDWEVFLNSINHYAYLARRIRNWYGFLMWVLIAFVFFSGIMNNWLILIISSILLVLVVVQKRKIHTFDASKNIQTFILPFIYYLKNDVWEETLLHLEIDLNPSVTVGKLDPKTKLHHFEWIKGRTRLMDGSEIQFKIKDIRRKWNETKRGLSGKIKTKTKYKIITKYCIKLSWDKRRYPKEIGDVPPKFKLKGKQKTKGPYNVFDPVAYSAVFKNAYQILSKKVA